MEPLITLTEFKKLAPEIDVSSFDDVTASGMLLQASQQVADYIEYDPNAGDVVDELKQARINTEGMMVIFPSKLPINSLASLSIVQGALTATVALTDGAGNLRYNIDFTKRKIVIPIAQITYATTPILIDFYSLRFSTFFAKYSYNAGWTSQTLPATIKQAVVLFAKDLFYAQFNPAGVSGIRQGALELRYGNPGNGLGGDTDSSAVKAAKKLLNPYRRIG